MKVLIVMVLPAVMCCECRPLGWLVVWALTATPTAPAPVRATARAAAAKTDFLMRVGPPGCVGVNGRMGQDT